MNRGELWLLDRPKPDKRRPVLILSRQSLIRSLHTATVVAVTSTRRGAPTEVEVGVDEGLKKPSCANLCNIFTVTQHELVRYVGSLAPEKMARVCRALVIATGCD
jgi:mRNA interferase MazF